MNDITVIARPHPFDRETLCATFPVGQTLAEILGAASHSCEARIGGVLVPRELWAMVKPKRGQFVHVRNFPQGGNSGKWLRSVLMVAVIVAAAYVTGGGAATLLGSGFAQGTTGALLLGAGVGIVGSLVVTPMIGGAREIAA